MNLRFLFLILVPVLWSCDTEELELPSECVNQAVVEDFTGLDGCGYLFKLSNGEYLQAVGPLPEEHQDFQFQHGKKVRIGFEYTNDYGSICMKGKTVIITCIESLEDEDATPAH